MIIHKGTIMKSNDTVQALHPLDPLSTKEIALASQILRQSKGLGSQCRFPYLYLQEPSKDEVIDYIPGQPMTRRAFSLILDKATGDTFEAVVDLRSQEIISWEKLDIETRGHAPIILEEFDTCVEIVQNDPDWRAALKARGLNDADIENIQIDPWSYGHFFENKPDYKHRRLMRGVAFVRDKLTDNGYARPIEGLVAIIDLNEGRVIELLDDGVDIPVPQRVINYDTPSLGKPREGLKPLHIIQPEGVSFTVDDDWKVSWQNWEFRVGFTPREGLVLHQLGYADKGKVRPIIYRASITDMGVPYSDEALNHYWKCAFDGGEYGLGRLANQLELGCDCLGAIRYFDIPTVNDLGEPIVMKNAICMHEEDYGTLWKHYEFRSGVYEIRRSRRLVISFFCTVANYDYGFYWYLYQDGTIQLEAKLTGIIQTGAVKPGEKPSGGMVTPELYGPTHQHFFSARLHMMVDGERNSVTETNFYPRPIGEGNQYGNVFNTETITFANELDACREANGQSGRFWKVINPNIKNSVGNHPGYKLVAEHNPVILAQPESQTGRRAGFARNHLWVTPYSPDERYGSGEYPNQHYGDGLPVWVKQNRPISNSDIVVWHTFGHTHVCKPEDFPVMPTMYVGFKLQPNNFFELNPAMDLPAGADTASVADGEGHSAPCCQHNPL
ncbi:primary-amine oxidase [Methylophilus sp. 13]|uniref:primary-amine oxidase n=1 Tax=Methylophilus sp. 13 TaxID=2781018 RepID=UPI001E5A0C47|nr:primary-amine oxidase [Methylophilus sp. 13]